MKKQLFIIAALCAVSMFYTPHPTPAHAATSNWQRGMNIVPQGPEDFASDNFKSSIQALKGTGMDYVTLIIPYYQQSQYNPTMGPGWNTPTDNALTSAITTAHAQGLKVMLKPHLESYDQAWRANINTPDRGAWFSAYGAMLQHYATIAKNTGVEQICIGTELISMASSYVNSDNTTRWKELIKNIRSTYSGKLTYSANSDPQSPWNNEKLYIGFWSDLDMAGISAYYDLGWDDSVEAFKNRWSQIRQSDIEPFVNSVGKPLLFTEIGYRSVHGAATRPWDYYYSNSADEIEQAHAYEAFLSFWNNYSYVTGVQFWEWETNPSAGGSGTTSYTPQHKQAENVLKQWFGGNPPPPSPTPTPEPGTTPPASGSLNISASTNTAPEAGQAGTFTVTLKNSGSSASGLNIDLEIYNTQTQQVYQQVFSNESLSQGQNKTYTLTWTPPTQGTYTLKGGIFNNTWTQNYYWQDNALTFTTGQATPPTQNPPPPSGGGNPPSSASTINIWWPTTGNTISGLQPFKAMIPGSDVNTYTMYWQVDGDALNLMDNSTTDYPHKESLVDVTGWSWRTTDPYHIAFIAKNINGSVITQAAIDVSVIR